MTEDGILIGALSRHTGCNIETIRYYERIGVLPHPRRTGRYRCYRPEDVGRLTFVRRARELGFTLDEVRALLKLAASDGDSTCAEVRQLAADHLADVRAKLADLKAMERALTDAVRRCDAGEQPGCPLIGALGG
jgi:MerR family mercuric resistance operon transcriptional regulator